MTFRAFLTFTALLAVMAVWSPARARTFVVLTGEWAPYVSESLEGGGPIARLVREAVQAAGHDVEIRFMPWPRAMSEVKSGREVASFPWEVTPSFAETCSWPELPLAHSYWVFFYLAERYPHWDYSSLEDMRELILGVSRGYFYVGRFDEAGLRLDYAPDAEASFKKLLRGWVDVIPEEYGVGRHILDKNHPRETELIGATRTPFHLGTSYIMVSRSHPASREFLEVVGRGLDCLAVSGRYQEYQELNRYDAGALD